MTVDSIHGLRAWSVEDELKLVAAMKLDKGDLDKNCLPTALAVDPGRHFKIFNVVIGYSNGQFSLYTLNVHTATFVHRYTHSSQTEVEITTIALSGPYVVAMTKTQRLFLYHFDTDWIALEPPPPQLVCSLGSQTVWPPLSLSLRSTTHSVIVSIAYALPTYLSGWSVAVQELHLTKGGVVDTSRLASGVKQGFSHLSPSAALEDSSSRSLTKPTSLAYTHPYLLTCHPDNTMVLYLVRSSEDELCISPGSRLWGHTSAVSGASVGSRGKAVSVNSRGSELRLWELKGTANAVKDWRSESTGDSSIQVRPQADVSTESATRPTESPSTSQHVVESSRRQHEDLKAETLTRHWIAFDEEKVVLLKREESGEQTLVIYDFT